MTEMIEHGQWMATRCADPICYEKWPELSEGPLKKYEGPQAKYHGYYCADCIDALNEEDRMKGSESYWQECE